MDSLARQDEVKSALVEFRKVLQADGADLEPLGISGTTAKVRLLLGPDACIECIMPKNVLEEIMLVSLRESIPDIDRVMVDDPRTE